MMYCSDLSTKLGGLKKIAKGKNDLERRRCFSCQEIGHLSRSCPKKVKGDVKRMDRKQVRFDSDNVESAKPAVISLPKETEDASLSNGNVNLGDDEEPDQL